MSPQAQLEQLLRLHKFKLVAQNKHLKYQNPEGKIFVTSKTPSDWRAIKNMVTTLKQVVANPIPTSIVVEEERQRRALEAEIALVAQRKATVGMSGAGKKARSNGTGFTYIDRPVQFITEDQKELDRLASEWVRLKHQLLRRRREAERMIASIFGFAQELVCVVCARGITARLVREARKNRSSLLRDKEMRTIACLRTFLWLKEMSFMQRPGERLFEFYQTGDYGLLYDGKRPVLQAKTIKIEHKASGNALGLQFDPTLVSDEMLEDMFDDILLTTETFFASDPNEKPEWLMPLADPEPLTAEERRALRFLVQFISDYGDADPDFVAHLKGFLVRRHKAA